MFESQFPCTFVTTKTVRKETDSSCFTQRPTGGSRKQIAVAFRDRLDLTQQGVGEDGYALILLSYIETMGDFGTPGKHEV